MIKLIALDMDGTVMNSRGELTAATAAAIKEAQAQGIEVIACTGRDYDGVGNVFGKAGIRIGGICMSGATVYDLDGRAADRVAMTKDSLRHILELFQLRGLYSDILTSDGAYSIDSEAMSEEIFKTFLGRFHGIDPDGMRAKMKETTGHITRVASIDELLERDIDIYKVVSFHGDLELIRDVKEQLQRNKELSVVSSFPHNVEITNRAAEKGRVLERYARKRNIAMAEVMAIGDSENDMSMIEMDFGYTVAMGNASEDIRAAAKYETKSNDEDGVAWAIHRWALAEDQ